jgi:hypothetical protein
VEKRYTEEQMMQVLRQVEAGDVGTEVCRKMESFFSTLKSECATEPYNSRAKARLSIFEYIEVWYNRQRRHSALGYTSPESFEKNHFESNRESSKSG